MSGFVIKRPTFTAQGIPPSYHDHFFGFSRWTKNCLPYKLDGFNSLVWTWTDGDCMFQNNLTKDLHLIEIKCQEAKAKAYQVRILKKLEELGVHIHILRLHYDPMWYGDHENLGDPRLTTKIEFNGQTLAYDDLLKQMLELHGMNANLKLSEYLHQNAVPLLRVLQNEIHQNTELKS